MEWIEKDDGVKYDMEEFKVIPKEKSDWEKEYEKEKEEKEPYESSRFEHHLYSHNFFDFTSCFFCKMKGDKIKNQCVEHMKCCDDEFVEQDGFKWDEWCENHCECECVHCSENQLKWEEWKKQGKEPSFECRKKKEKSKKKSSKKKK